MIALAHANAADVMAGNTPAAGYTMQDRHGKPTTDPAKAARVYALDAAGAVLGVFPARPAPTAFLSPAGAVSCYEWRGASSSKRTIRQQEFTLPTGPQLELF
jgi:hypothetical protein